MPAYDDTNVFARVLRGELPCHRVLDDDVALAFMDVMPRVDGHVLVIPKAPARTLFDVSPDDLGALVSRVQRVASAARRAFEAPGLTLQQFNEAEGGQSVFHLHFHLLPRPPGDVIRPEGGPMADPAVLAEHAARIRAALQTD